MGDSLGHFSLSLGDFFTQTSGHLDKDAWTGYERVLIEKVNTSKSLDWKLYYTSNHNDVGQEVKRLKGHLCKENDI